MIYPQSVSYHALIWEKLPTAEAQPDEFGVFVLLLWALKEQEMRGF